jgi:hypothetical protein
MVSGGNRLIGEILADLGHVTPEQVQEALARQAGVDPSHSPPLLGEILVEMGAVTDDQVREALAAQGKQVSQATG